MFILSQDVQKAAAKLPRLRCHLRAGRGVLGEALVGYLAMGSAPCCVGMLTQKLRGLYPKQVNWHVNNYLPSGLACPCYAADLC